MSENNYGALMMKSAVGASDDINAIFQPGIYIIPPSNTSSPDATGGVLIVHSGTPIRRTFTSSAVICLTSTRNGSTWSAWKGPLSRTNPFADIKADGPAAIAEALSNLGLGAGSALPVGIPVPWPMWGPPPGWLKCNGAAFTAAQYPQLALCYPSLQLPDLRGEFIRGWDDGRNIDAGRAIISVQKATTIQGSLESDASGTYISVTNYDAVVTGAALAVGPLQYTGYSRRETYSLRPRNVAFNYIVRAA